MTKLKTSTNFKTLEIKFNVKKEKIKQLKNLQNTIKRSWQRITNINSTYPNLKFLIDNWLENKCVQFL